MTNEQRRGSIASVTAALVLATAAALMSSCAARSSKTNATPTAVPPTNVTPGQPRPDTGTRERIDALWSQIEQWRAGAGASTIEGAMCTAPQPKTPQCSDVCRITGSICTNAGKICELAKSLPGDTWAANKCSEANAACEHATKRCCGCVGAE